MVQRGDGKQTLQAMSLRIGESVYCSGDRVETLTDMRRFSRCTAVVQVSFLPDEPVEAFSPPQQAIQSKGHG